MGDKNGIRQEILQLDLQIGYMEQSIIRLKNRKKELKKQKREKVKELRSMQ